MRFSVSFGENRRSESIFQRQKNDPNRTPRVSEYKYHFRESENLKLIHHYMIPTFARRLVITPLAFLRSRGKLREFSYLVIENGKRVQINYKSCIYGGIGSGGELSKNGYGVCVTE